MKKYIVPIIFLILSGITYTLYHLKGQEVLEDGTLKESFGFIPLTYLFIAGFVISTIVILIKNASKK